jgi:hypothetical protein
MNVSAVGRRKFMEGGFTASIWSALLLIAIWGAGALPAAGFGQGREITAANWERNPQIIAIRGIVGPINAGLKSGAYKTSEREFNNCEGQFFVIRRIARDSRGAVAWYEDYLEGEDATWDFQYYYDSAGRLRFVFAMARSTNGTREQLRIYFDETAKRLWKNDKFLKGPGCPGCFSAYYDSDKALAFDPGKEFANDEGCEEIKAHSKPGK